MILSVLNNIEGSLELEDKELRKRIGQVLGKYISAQIQWPARKQLRDAGMIAERRELKPSGGFRIFFSITKRGKMALAVYHQAEELLRKR